MADFKLIKHKILKTDGIINNTTVFNKSAFIQ